jgi:hypothetical protein
MVLEKTISQNQTKSLRGSDINLMRDMREAGADAQD